MYQVCIMIPQYNTVTVFSHHAGEAARDQWIVPAAKFVGSTLGSRALNNLIDRHLCGQRNTEIQQTTERSAKFMALVQVLDDINAAEQSLNALVNEKFSVKGDRIAEVQFNKAVSAEINSIRDTLGNAGNYIKGAARNILCN